MWKIAVQSPADSAVYREEITENIIPFNELQQKQMYESPRRENETKTKIKHKSN